MTAVSRIKITNRQSIIVSTVGSVMLSLTGVEPYVKLPYLVIVFGMILWGILTLALQNCESAVWLKNKDKISLGLGTVGTLIFIITLQPYAAVFTLIFLAIKALMLIKWS